MTDPYTLSRSWMISDERERLQGLCSRARSALTFCRTTDNRACVQARLDVWSGMLATLDRAASRPPHPDTRGSMARQEDAV